MATEGSHRMYAGYLSTEVSLGSYTHLVRVPNFVCHTEWFLFFGGKIAFALAQTYIQNYLENYIYLFLCDMCLTFAHDRINVCLFLFRISIFLN